MSTKTPTPKDLAQIIDPMSKDDPLYAVTCNLFHVHYGYPGHTPPRYYGQEGWPPEYLLEPTEPGTRRGFMVNPWPEPVEVEREPWVPWTTRDAVAKFETAYDAAAAIDVTNWVNSWEDDGGAVDPVPEHLTQRVLDAVRDEQESVLDLSGEDYESEDKPLPIVVRSEHVNPYPMGDLP